MFLALIILTWTETWNEQHPINPKCELPFFSFVKHSPPSDYRYNYRCMHPSIYISPRDIWAHFLSLARNKLRLCSASHGADDFLSLARSKLRLYSSNHRAAYFNNLACDWLSIIWAYSEQEAENGPCIYVFRNGLRDYAIYWILEIIHFNTRHLKSIFKFSY